MRTSIRETHVIDSACIERLVPIEDACCAPLAKSQVSIAGLSSLRGEYRIGRPDPRFHTIIYTLSGAGELESEPDGMMKRGTVAILPVGAPTLYAIRRAPWEIAWFHLKRRRIWSALESHEPSITTAREGESIAFYLHALLRESHRASPDAVRLAQLHSEALAVHLRRELGGAALCGLDPDREEALHQLWRDVEADLAHGWTNAEMARRVHLSEGRFRQVVTDAHGTSPMRMVTKLRMQRAMLLLTTTGEKVYRVADLLGYDNPFAFATAFKRTTGKWPSQVRKHS